MGKISEEFKQRLESLDPKSELEVLIFTNMPEDLEKKIEEETKGMPKRSKERIGIIKKYHLEGMKPITEYLDGKNTTYKQAPILQCVYTTLQVRDIFELVDNENVTSIVENQKISLVKPKE